MRGITTGFWAAALALAVFASTAQAQTKPAVTSLDPNYPKTEMFIGNSFFYYNNGMPGHVSLLERRPPTPNTRANTARPW